MSCQLDTVSVIDDILSINKYLKVENIKKENKFDDDNVSWNESDWSWGDQPNTEVKKVQLNGEWLQDVFISMSSTEEFIVIANQEKIVFLTQKWDYNGETSKLKYFKCFEGCLTQEPNERITCVLCVPLASQKRSTTGSADWTSIMVGFSSGYVRIYTENGTLLISQIFSEEEIVRMKCHTYHRPRHSAEADGIEEVCILYKNSLVTIDGFSFFQSLKACKNQVARATASGGEMLQPPPLAYKKWALLEQSSQRDFYPCGVINSTIFDQMKTDSLIIGPHANPRSTLVAVNLYMSTGSQPFLAFYFTQHAHTQPFLSDVAHAMASKLKSAFLSAASGWLGIGGSKSNQTDKKEIKKPKIEPATNISPRFGLYDKRRSSSQIELSSDGKMAAVVDDFGRVLLIDVARGVVVRMWKGYRDAQVAWLEATEEDLNNMASNVMRRSAFFLVIYAPRRSLLEVWVCQMGARIATYTVGKTCRLLTTCGMLGLNSATVTHPQAQTHSAAFLLDAEGNLTKISVPFHLALGDKGSVGIHDMHLLKKLRSLLKENPQESESFKKELLAILYEIKTSEIKKQALDQIMSTKYLTVEFLSDLNKQFEAYLKNAVVENVNNYMWKHLLYLCHYYQLLLQTYSKISVLNTEEPLHYDPLSNLEILKTYLKLDETELIHLEDSFTNYFHLSNQHENKTAKSVGPKVRFSVQSNAFSAAEFLSHFECKNQKAKTELRGSNQKTKNDLNLNYQNPEKIITDSEAVNENDLESGNIIVEDNMDSTSMDLQSDADDCINVNAVFSDFTFDAKKMKLAEFLFNYIFIARDWKELQDQLQISCILYSDLMKLLVHYILSKKITSLNCLPALINIIQTLSSKKEEKVNWKEFVAECCQTNNIPSALLLLAIAKHVNEPQSHEELGEWEAVLLDREDMVMRCNRLQDLLELHALLIMTTNNNNLREQPVADDRLLVSLKKVEEGGRGIIPEFVGKWVHSNDIPLSCIATECLPPNATNEIQNNTQQATIINQINRLYKCFPVTVTKDSIVANCCFEYAVLWNKDPENIGQLDVSLQYLQHLQNDHLQQGLASMLWHMFVSKRISSATLLIDKVGKTPKDRLCRKDIGMNEVALIKLLKLSIILLNLHLENKPYNELSPLVELPVMVEDNWDVVLGSSSGSSSLIQLALEQRPASSHFVEVHLNLCRILVAILQFNIKSVKPKSQLFDSKTQLLLLRPLHSTTTISHPSDVDSSLANARISFLKCIITQTILTMGDNIGYKLSSEQNITYSYWSEIVSKLGAFFQVDMEPVHMHHVLELYNSAYDQIAQQVSLNVTNRNELGSELLQLCGQRLAYRIQSVPASEAAEILSRCSPNTSTWLKSQVTSHLRCPNLENSLISELLNQIIQMLDEDSSLYKNALELIDFVQTFD